MKTLRMHIKKLENIKRKDKFFPHLGMAAAAGAMVGILAALIHAAF